MPGRRLKGLQAGDCWRVSKLGHGLSFCGRLNAHTGVHANPEKGHLMHALGRDPKRMCVAVVSMTATVAVCLLSLFGAAGAQGAMIKSCPSAASLKSAAGTPLTLQSKAAGADVLCHYTHVLSATTQDSVSVAVEPMSESNAAFLSDAKAFAKDLKAPLKKLSGIGDEAWEYTEPKSKVAGNGTPTTTVTIVVGKREVTVIADIPAKNVLAVAKRVS
jgi:hypothetical protein